MHNRVGLHQVAFLGHSTTSFVAHCQAIGVAHVTLVTQVLGQPAGVNQARAALAAGGVAVAAVNHAFGVYPDLERDNGSATAALARAVEMTADVGAPYLYLLTGGRGQLSWEQAAQRFADLVAPAKQVAEQRGVTLLVENASPFNADIHIAHTLADVVTLAEIAGIGVCVDLHACWFEAGLDGLLARAVASSGLVQVSDYVLGDRAAPCRAVPGDGTIPLRRILDVILSAGYTGVFDLELVGPRIASEGPEAATARAAEWLSTTLAKLGA